MSVLRREMAMHPEYDPQRISTAREQFLARGGQGANAHGVRAEVAELWTRSAQAGLPVQTRGLRFQIETRGERRIRLFTGRLFEECVEQLVAMGCVVGLLRTDFTVLHVQGGTLTTGSFGRAFMASTAAGLVNRERREAWLMGEEHYTACLREYATYAWLSDDPYSRYIVCVVLPQKLFTRMFLLMIRHFRQRRALHMELAACRSELTCQNELFNQLKDIQDDALILVDYSQKIICVNRQFEQAFELSQADVLRHDLSEILPELESMISCMRTGKAMQMCETTFEGLPFRRRTMYVSCTPWRQNGVINGMVLSLTATRRVAPAAAKTASSADITLDDLIGVSPAFMDVKKMVRSVADSNSSIILTGESGTGKELFARAIHNDSVRVGKPFVAVNCSAIPKELIGSELFGYSDGAFTGARKGGAMGKFEYANGGTLLLDEIGELPLDVQAILLRVLEERAVVRIGDNKVTPVDVRIISATNRDLLQMIKDQTFRLDLYYRLNVINLELPPLRQRREDIPLLAQAFIQSLSESLHKDVTSLAPDALDCLCAYDWPGNVRQLHNVVERGVNMAETRELRLRDLPAEVTSPCAATTPQPAVVPLDVGARSYEEWERQRIWELMQQFRANKSRIAEELGMSRGTLYKKIRRYGL